jgi:hypothetical protein
MATTSDNCKPLFLKQFSMYFTEKPLSTMTKEEPNFINVALPLLPLPKQQNFTLDDTHQ